MRDENSRRKIIRPQFFAWTGSLLAAAASVVIFLQITGKAPTPVASRQSMETMTRHRSFPARDQMAKSTAAKSISRSVDADNDKDHDIMAANEITSPAAVAPATPAMKMTGHAAAGYGQPQATVKNKQPTLDGSRSGTLYRLQTTAGKKGSPGRLWLDRVQQGCRHNETSSQFWQQQYRTGKQLAMLQDPAEKQLIRELLPLVAELQGKGNDAQAVCEEILKRFKDVTLK